MNVKTKSLMKEEALTRMVPLKLNLQEQSPDMIKVSDMAIHAMPLNSSCFRTAKSHTFRLSYFLYEWMKK